MTIQQIVTNNDSLIRQQTQPESITPNVVATQLDYLANELGKRGVRLAVDLAELGLLDNTDGGLVNVAGKGLYQFTLSGEASGEDVVEGAIGFWKRVSGKGFDPAAYTGFIRNQSAEAQDAALWIKQGDNEVKFNANGLAVNGALFATNLPASTNPAGQFVVNDGGQLRYRTAAQIRADLGINTSGFANGGNAFGVAGVLGTTDSQRLSFITGGLERARITATGNLLIGTPTDGGYTVDIYGAGAGSLRVKPSTISSNENFFVAETNMGTKVFTISGGGTISMYNATNVMVKNIFNSGASRGAIAINDVAGGNANGLINISGSVGAVGAVLVVKNTSNTLPKILDVRKSDDASIFYVSDTIVYGLTLKTATPSGASGAGAWKLGKALTATVTAKTDAYIEVEIDGTVYKLGIVE